MKRYILPLVCASFILCSSLCVSNAVRSQSVRIVFAGDLMGHMSQHRAAQRPDGSYDYAPCYRHVGGYVSGADLAIVNLEVPLDGKPYSGYPQFSAPDALARDARDAGFDIMTTANNHCMDRGRHGLERTLRALDSMHIPHLGTYLNRKQHDDEHPMVVDVKGIKVGLLCYTYGTNGYEVQKPNVVNLIDTDQMERDLRVARERGAEFVVTLIHWGVEYALKANKEQEQTARWLLQHGCDAVIGGHPHVVQNFTLDAIPDNNRYPEIVVYSMGNLVSNQRFPHTDGGIMIELTLERKGAAVVAERCQYLPFWVHRGKENGLHQYYIVPTADAVAHPERYEIGGSDLKDLQTFDRNTRQRLAECSLKNGASIEEMTFRPSAYMVPSSPSGVVPLRRNPALRLGK